MFRRRMKEETSAAATVSCGLGCERPWYCASCNLDPPKGKAFQTNSNSLEDSVNSSRSRFITSSSASSSPVNGYTTPKIPVARKGIRPVSQWDRQKCFVRGGNGRSKVQQEPSTVSDDPESTLQKEMQRSAERTIRSILKHETEARIRPHDDNRSSVSPVGLPTKQQQQQQQRCHQPAVGQSLAPPSIPPLPIRQSRIPRCTFFNSYGDAYEPKTAELSRSKSSNECCYRRPTFSLESQYPAATNREDAGPAKQKSGAKLHKENERSASRQRVSSTATDGETDGSADCGAATGTRSVPGNVLASGRRVDIPNPNYDRRLARRHSENDVGRSPRRSPRMDFEERSANSGSWSNNIDIVPTIPTPQPSQSAADDKAPTASIFSDTSGSTRRPYFRRIFESLFDWLSSFADTQWTNLKMIKQAAENYVVPETKSKREGERLRSKSCRSTSCSRIPTSPSELDSACSLSDNSCGAQVNQTEPTSSFPSAYSRSCTEKKEEFPSLSPEDKLGACSRKQTNSRPVKSSSSKPELKSSKGSSSSSRISLQRSTDPMTSMSAMEINGNRLDRLQQSAADAITQMRGPDFVFPQKLFKSETLLTKSLTKEFEDVANAPPSSHRTSQLRKLLTELPVENFYVVEWLVTNNIINESNANKFGRLCHVKPHVLEVLTRNRNVLFPDAL